DARLAGISNHGWTCTHHAFRCFGWEQMRMTGLSLDFIQYSMSASSHRYQKPSSVSPGNFSSDALDCTMTCWFDMFPLDGSRSSMLPSMPTSTTRSCHS